VIKLRRVRWARHVETMAVLSYAYTILEGGVEGKRPLERPRRPREYNIRKDLREIKWEGMGWIHQTQGRD
jgi:hypothetical protein